MHFLTAIVLLSAFNAHFSLQRIIVSLELATLTVRKKLALLTEREDDPECDHVVEEEENRSLRPSHEEA